MTGAPYTEEQAKDVWCPYVRVTSDKDGGVNKYGNGDLRPGTYCIASRCAAWRWAEGLSMYRVGKSPKDRRGYCGPCGKPEFEE